MAEDEETRVRYQRNVIPKPGPFFPDLNQTKISVRWPADKGGYIEILSEVDGSIVYEKFVQEDTANTLGVDEQKANCLAREFDIENVPLLHRTFVSCGGRSTNHLLRPFLERLPDWSE